MLKYQDRLFNTLVRVLGSVEDARDVAQEAFVQAFLKLESYQRRAAFYTWLYRIAFNMAISHKRKQKTTTLLSNQGKDSEGGDQSWDPPSGEEEPSANLERDEKIQQIQQALTKLSDDHRAVIVLRELEGCCYEAIAELLDIPLGTVRSRIRRARMQLREILKETSEPDTH